MLQRVSIRNNFVFSQNKSHVFMLTKKLWVKIWRKTNTAIVVLYKTVFPFSVTKIQFSYTIKGQSTIAMWYNPWRQPCETPSVARRGVWNQQVVLQVASSAENARASQYRRARTAVSLEQPGESSFSFLFFPFYAESLDFFVYRLDSDILV